MRKLANELLSFSKSALLEHQIPLAPVNLADAVDAAIRQEKSGTFPIDVQVPRDLGAQGNFDLLQRALGNLLRNALRYGERGKITVRGWEERGQVFLTVADEGPRPRAGRAGESVRSVLSCRSLAHGRDRWRRARARHREELRRGVRRGGQRGEPATARAGGAHPAQSRRSANGRRVRLRAAGSRAILGT